MKLTKNLQKRLQAVILGIPLIFGAQGAESPRSGIYDDDSITPLEDVLSNALLTFQRNHVCEKKMVFEFDKAPWLMLIADVRQPDSDTLEKGCVYVMNVTGEKSSKPRAALMKLSIFMPQDAVGIYHGHIHGDNWSINLLYHGPHGAESLETVNLVDFRKYNDENPEVKKRVFQEYFQVHKSLQLNPSSEIVAEREAFVLLRNYHRNFGLRGQRILY